MSSIVSCLGVQDVSVAGLDRSLFVFDYSKINSKYHARSSPEEEIVVYKGAITGLHTRGFSSLALQEGRQDHLLEVKRTIEEGTDEQVYAIFNRHTSYYHYTPLLSSHPNPEWAQVFASTHPLRKYDKTIYQITLKSKRCIVDIYDTGRCGEVKEVMIIGAIFPDEITAVKIVNDDAHSELLDKGN